MTRVGPSTASNNRQTLDGGRFNGNAVISLPFGWTMDVL